MLMKSLNRFALLIATTLCCVAIAKEDDQRQMLRIAKNLDNYMDKVAEAHPDTHWRYKDTRVFRTMLSNKTSPREKDIQMRQLPGLDSLLAGTGILEEIASGNPPCPLELMALAIKLASPPPPPPTEEGHPCSWMTRTTLLPAPTSPMQFLQCRPVPKNMIKMPIPNIPGLPPLPIPGLNPQDLVGGMITGDMLPPMPYMDKCGAYLTQTCPSDLFFNTDEEVCAFSPGGGAMGAIGGLAGMAMG